MALRGALAGLTLVVIAGAVVYTLHDGSPRTLSDSEGQGLTLAQQGAAPLVPLDEAQQGAAPVTPSAPVAQSHIPAHPATVEARPGAPAPVPAQRVPAAGGQQPATGYQAGGGGDVQGFDAGSGLPDLTTLLDHLPLFDGCLLGGIPVLCKGQTPTPPGSVPPPTAPPVTAPPVTVPPVTVPSTNP
jgi:hypothetical protein